MAFLNAQGIARVALPLLSRALVLPRTFTMVPQNGFTGPNGETIGVRVRLPRTARTQAAPGASITYDDQNEVEVLVTLAHLYDAIHITDEDLSLSLEDFASQVTAPQVASVAEGAEQEVYDVLNAAAADATIEFALAEDPADTDAVVKALRERLSTNKVPTGNRWLAAAPDIYSRLLGVDKFVRADATGDGPSSALRDAIVGRIYGFQVVEAVGLDTGTAVAYHSSGGLFASKKPADPRGAKESAAISDQGINIRQIFQYDPDVLSDASVLSTFAGFSLVFEDAGGTDNDRWIKVGTSSV